MILAVDAGGTYLRGEIYLDDILIKSLHVKSTEIGLSKWIKSILKEQKEIKSVSVAYAGQVKDGVIISAPNIKIDNHDIKNYFKQMFDVELFIENDLNCAVLAEAEYFKSDDICALYVGTGLGFGAISSSTLIKGYGNVAAELGHIPYKNAPFKCGCGRDNCIELFASGSAIDKWKKHSNLKSTLNLKELKDSSNKVENRIYEEFVEALLYAVGTAITLFNPQILVLGGGIITSNSELLEIITSNIKKYAMTQALKDTKILSSKLKNAPIKGALLLKSDR